MNLEKIYGEIGGDYEGVKERLYSEALIERVLNKFLDDQEYAALCTAVTSKNIEDSFLHAHALKGVAGNLGFSKLYEDTCALTEQLRAKSKEADQELFERVQGSYQEVIAAIIDGKES